MIVITDFYEGRPEGDLIKAFKSVLEGGSKVLGIAALGPNAQPFYNKSTASNVRKLGIDIIASTPESLPEIIAKLMQN